MMTDIPVIGKFQPVLQDGKAQNDAGKKVLINLVGGALKNETGIVVQGPYRIIFRAKRGQLVKKNGKVKKVLKDCTVITNPYWCVQLDSNRFCIHFSESELKFL